MTHKYGDFSENQIKHTKELMRKKIFFLLICVDPKTKDDYKDIDIIQAFDNILHWLGGLNEILNKPNELVLIISLLEAALIEITSPEFNTNNFSHCAYRKLILDAGAEVLKIKEV